MIKPAMSTVACPEWTLDRVAASARSYGFGAVELRTFGDGSRSFACDPALTDGAKVRRIFGDAGVEIASLATSCRFDDPISPPVIGLVISDTERSVREARRAVDLAAAVAAPLVRVFAFETAGRESARSGAARIARRLAMVADHARHSGVKLVIENGGSYPTAAAIRGIIDAVDSPLLGACYSIGPAAGAGERPDDGVDLLGDRLWLARIKDARDGRPCPLGEGTFPCREFVRSLTLSGFDGALVYEWDRAWVPGLPGPDEPLRAAVRTLFDWAAPASVA